MSSVPSVLLLLVTVVLIALLLLAGDNSSQAYVLVHSTLPRAHRQVARQWASPWTTRRYTSSGNACISLEISASAADAAIVSHAVVSGSTVELLEPETGCHVILLGCFHGSQSSAADVVSCITSDTNVVCLELCATRFEDLRRDLLQDQQQEESSAKNSDGTSAAATSQMRKTTKKKKRLWMFRFAEMVQKKVQSRGLSTGIAAALLGGVSGMQTALSGLEPGLEFRRALERVQCISSYSSSSSSSNANDARSCDIVLADQNVDETLQKVGQLPSLAVDMWKDCLQHGWEASCGIEASALKTALAGSSSSSSSSSSSKLHQQVTIWNFLTRNPAAVRDMIRLVLPPMLLLNALAWSARDSTSVLLDWPFASTVEADFASVASSPMAHDPLLMAMTGVAANWLFAFFLYVSVALPVARVVLRERDDTLASRIRQACHLALQQQQQQSIDDDVESAQESPPPIIRVVAVLGYLHVNGVAQRLLKQQNYAEQDVGTSPEI